MGHSVPRGHGGQHPADPAHGFATGCYTVKHMSPGRDTKFGVEKGRTEGKQEPCLEPQACTEVDEVG